VIDCDVGPGVLSAEMRAILAPEFRGYINRYLVLPSLGAGAYIFSVLFAVVAVLPPQSTSAATNSPAFSRVSSSTCAAPFHLSDIEGRERSLAEQKGRPVAVHFFATWCEPCQAELRTLQKFYEGHRDKIDVLAVNVGEVRARVRGFLATTPVGFPVLLDSDRAVTKAWSVDGLPATFVLDDTLRPVLHVTGDLDWTQANVAAEIESALMSPTVSRDPDCTKEHPQ
jgi:thiol-disulfide isomerase/thioredoxin